VPDDPKSFFLSREIAHYLVGHGTPPDPLQRRLIDETAALGPVSRMQIAPEQGALMTLLARLIDARRAVEVGTFTGYSALCLARGMAPDGRLVCCDVNEEWTAVARRYWKEAGLDDKIELRLGPATETLRSFPAGAETAWDLAFIDADKGSYPVYWEEILLRLRPGGLVMVDNVLWSGRVVDPSATHEDTEAIRKFNDLVAADQRVDAVMLPVSDGLTLARKR
jgi:caffeoyl-CoA O-methyltransferase